MAVAFPDRSVCVSNRPPLPSTICRTNCHAQFPILLLLYIVIHGTTVLVRRCQLGFLWEFWINFTVLSIIVCACLCRDLIFLILHEIYCCATMYFSLSSFAQQSVCYPQSPCTACVQWGTSAFRSSENWGPPQLDECKHFRQWAICIRPIFVRYHSRTGMY